MEQQRLVTEHKKLVEGEAGRWRVPSRGVLEMAVAVSGAVTVSRQAARSIMLLAGG
jgi:hypothetical protein